MKQPQVKFALQLLALTLILGVVQWQLNQTNPRLAINDNFLMLVFFAVSGLVVQGVLLKFSERKGALFVRVFIVTTALKFMLYLAVLIGLLLYSSENRQSLVLHFLVYYLVFTALETRTMYGVIRKMKA